MKLVATVLAGLFAVTAFAAEPAKKAEAKPAATAPAKKEEKKAAAPAKKAEKKAEAAKK